MERLYCYGSMPSGSKRRQIEIEKEHVFRKRLKRFEMGKKVTECDKEERFEEECNEAVRFEEGSSKEGFGRRFWKRGREAERQRGREEERKRGLLCQLLCQSA